MKTLTASIVLGACLALPVGAALAQPAQLPAKNVSAKKHPNLAAAQQLLDKAFEKLTASQRANEFDEGGHAAKAKELLDQASAEIKQAAEYDNAKKK